ncbi:MAG TPA: efflux RND transporter permease subunit [Actinobacteria bacterium]|nr:efflux RND transporter permease subunit [Actinomycetota bacterium]
MEFLTRFSLRSPAVIVIAVVLLFAGGIWSAQQLPLETMPDLDIPIVTVVTVYPGAGPSEVLEEITKPLEKATRNIDNAKTQNSTSSDNVSVIVMEFDFGDDLDKAKREVEDAVKAIALPEAAQTPKVGRISFSSMPIMRLSIAGENNKSIQTLRFTKDDIVPELQGIDGVGSVQLTADDESAVRIELSPKKLRENNLTAAQVSQFLVASNLAFPAGELTLKGRILPVTVGQKFDSVKAIKDMPLLSTPSAGASQQAPGSTGAGAPGGQAGSRSSSGQSGASQIKIITLGEIAKVSRGSDRTTVASRLNDKSAFSVNIIKEPDANTVDVADDIGDKIDSLRDSGPKGLKIKVVEDASIMVRESIGGLLREGLMGSVLAMLVILIFLGNWRSTLIAAISIPLSVVISLIALKQLGITLNIMSLAGLAVAVGRIVDDSIVVIENIYRHRQKNDLAGNDLITYGTKEVTSAITSSTFTVVGAFIPLALVSGFIGQVFTPFAVAVVTSILASLIVALTVVPLMAKYLIAGQHGKGGREVMSMSKTYQRSLRWSLDHKAIVLIVSFIFFFASLGLIRLIGSNFLPTDEQNQLNITIDMPAGTSFKALDDKSREVEELVKGKSVKDRLATVGSGLGQQDFFSSAGSANQANIFLELTDDADPEKIAETLRRRLNRIAGKAEISVAEIDSMGGMTSRTEVLVRGDNLKDLRKAADKVSRGMKKIDGLANVEDNLEQVKDGVFVDVDSEKAVKVGLTSAQIGGWLRELLVGKNVTRVTLDDEAVDVSLGLKSQTFDKPVELADLAVPTPLGLSVKLGDIADVREHPTPVTITRRDERQFASITAEITTSDSGRVTRDIKAELEDMKLPRGVTTKISGVSEQMEEGFSQLGMAMLVAVGVVYLIMVLAFGEARAPLAILFSLPFAATGALIGLYVTGQQISVSSMIGGLMLIGIVVTNAIVLIELVQQKRAAGMPTREALLEGGATRLRPILMTAATTIFALLPLGLGLSDGGLISQSLAVTVIGGLTTSTALTLIIAPVIFEILSNIGAKKPANSGNPGPKSENAVA